MYWVIQNDLFSEEGHESLLRALDVMGLPHSVHKIVPFVHDLEPEPVIPPGMKVIVLGAYTMLSIARDRGWTPGAYDLGQNAEVPLQVIRWGRERILNADARITPLNEVQPFLRPSFVRPTRDSKAFAGRVFDWHEFTEWREHLPDYVTERIGLVLVAPWKRIYAEYRTWVVNGHVVSASQYKQGTSVLYDANVPEGILHFAQECVDIWNPARAYVLDVADTDDGLFVVETNTINAAGWYKGNVGRIVAALERMDG